MSSEKLLRWYLSLKGGKVYKGIIKWRKICWDRKEGGIEISLTLTERGKKQKRDEEHK